MQTIQGKAALVTGAASGIGRAIALRLADEGADLFLLDIDEIGLTKMVATVRRKNIEAIGRHCDLSQPAQISQSVAHILDRWSGVDILVNNAGIAYYGKTSEMSAEHCERLLAINLHAPIQLTRELLPSLLMREEAHLLNVASFLGLVGSRRVAAYCASKFGLVGFTEALRAEYARSNLGVTALCPGFVDTDLFTAAAHGDDLTTSKQPAKWLQTTPEKIADCAVKAIYRDQAVVVPQAYAKLAHLGKRLVPGILDWAHHLSRHRKQTVSVSLHEGRERRRAA